MITAEIWFCRIVLAVCIFIEVLCLLAIAEAKADTKIDENNTMTDEHGYRY